MNPRYAGVVAVTRARGRGRPPSGGREEILRATVELLQETGIAKLTTRAVADRAGVSEGSVFYHFADRAGLLTAAFETSLGPMHLAQATDRADLPTLLRTVSDAIQEFLASSMVVLIAAQADAELRERLAAYMIENDYGPHRGIDGLGAMLAGFQAAGELRADLDTRVIASMVVNDAMQRVVGTRLIGHDRGLIEQDRFLDTLLLMITPDDPAQNGGLSGSPG
jgi:AcrR family transcriptional regulator